MGSFVNFPMAGGGIVEINGKRGREAEADCWVIEFISIVNRIGDFGGAGAFFNGK